MSFSGFTEEDIRKLTKPKEAINRTDKLNKEPEKKATFKPKPKTNVKHDKLQSSANHKYSNNNGSIQNKAIALPAGARLSPPRPETDIKDLTSTLPVLNGDGNNKQSKAISEIDDKDIRESQGDQTQNQTKKVKDLEQFEAKQKLMEEKNRKRKELLSKALADRTKQTQEETQRLNTIQEEFKKLDAMLSTDVKILRKEIEVACIDYTECQKRFNKIEREFLDAKVLLHQKLEKKEMLTEHLCTIIEKNEERKAEKLIDLLHKLEINSLEMDESDT